MPDSFSRQPDSFLKSDAPSPGTASGVDARRSTFGGAMRSITSPPHLENLTESFDQQMQYWADQLLMGDDLAGADISKAEMKKNTPSVEAIQHALESNANLSEKMQQGFTNILTVPFGLSRGELTNEMQRAMWVHSEDRNLRSSDGKNIVLPLKILDNQESMDSPVYLPDRFDPQDHGGRTKKQLFEKAKFPGWQVFLTENLQNIPLQGTGKIIGGRDQVEAGRTSSDYLRMFQGADYTHEIASTLEAYQALFLMHLLQTKGEVLDSSAARRVCMCLGEYFPKANRIPCAASDQGANQILFNVASPNFSVPACGTRTMVKVF